MAHLKSEPSRAIRTAEEFFAIARMLEQEAAAGYVSLANRARSEGIPELALLFDQLAEEEQAHVKAVEEWSRRELTARPGPIAVDWGLPSIFDVETGTELARSRLSTAYKILSLAVNNKERAFEFWTYVAAQAHSAAVRKLAEKMAHAELEHVSLLRGARRKAFHAERENKDQPSAKASSERLMDAAALELQLARQLDEVAGRSIDGLADRLHRLAAQCRANALEITGEASPGVELNPPPIEAVDSEKIIAMAERLVEEYLEIGEGTSEEATLAKAQMLATKAIERIALLRSLPSMAGAAPGNIGVYEP